MYIPDILHVLTHNNYYVYNCPISTCTLYLYATITVNLDKICPEKTLAGQLQKTLVQSDLLIVRLGKFPGPYLVAPLAQLALVS